MGVQTVLVPGFGEAPGPVRFARCTAAHYFAATSGRAERGALEAAVRKARRWQYTHPGAQQPHFGKLLAASITPAQAARVQNALAWLI